ncbi:MAG: SDR family NAD(P)-dependent oxidoreductase [Candidatus Taylorbacteria bacterium]|nr:SDR family NAD(P)-dependent oxidoreductase [Candidatus Taylorbacteria bacterium]
MNKLEAIIQKDILEILPKIDFKELNGKTILITGASGLIGTYLLATMRELADEGFKIQVIALTQGGFPKYLSHFGENVKFIKGDLTNQKLLDSILKVDYIIHAAGYGQPGKFLEDPTKTIELNTTCTINLIKKLKTNGKFLFISTSEVYSGLETPPFKEEQIGTTNTNHPRACYIEGKRCGEAIVNAYRGKGVEAKSARLSLAYGPGTKKGDKRVLNAFIEKALGGKLELLDQGISKRTYCYVSDAVEVLWQILFFGKESVYNVGGISNTTIAQLAKMIGTSLDTPVIFPKNTTNHLQEAPTDVQLDMTKAVKEFKKTDYIPLNDGLERTIRWQQILYKT